MKVSDNKFWVPGKSMCLLYASRPCEVKNCYHDCLLWWQVYCWIKQVYAVHSIFSV